MRRTRLQQRQKVGSSRLGPVRVDSAPGSTRARVRLGPSSTRPGPFDTERGRCAVRAELLTLRNISSES
ncbi:hypothetical protein F2P81_015427 [Scophthalmus maximus]|uniref:Uncharacterized protein n=1 Tax=Scophthalmus maximus TaxID=52904 RepID=A0A6A4SIR2_SCOMX|nr:hypothetical protein F2P81_015427 [Scophthalmus maximus]